VACMRLLRDAFWMHSSESRPPRGLARGADPAAVFGIYYNQSVCTNSPTGHGWQPFRSSARRSPVLLFADAAWGTVPHATFICYASIQLRLGQRHYRCRTTYPILLYMAGRCSFRYGTTPVAGGFGCSGPQLYWYLSPWR
jgi:hypothetical protein